VRKKFLIVLTLTLFLQFKKLFNIHYLHNLHIIKLFLFNLNNTEFNWGLGIGDWGLGIGDWGVGPKTKNPNPKHQQPKPKLKKK